jgi:hypothetical protein
VDAEQRKKVMTSLCAAIFPGGPPSLAGQAEESGGEAPSPS